MNPKYPLVAERAGHRCEYCHAPEVVFNFPFEVEHIIPTARGGADDYANCALGCRSCNLYKLDQIDAEDLQTGLVIPLFHPRDDDWGTHFRFDPRTGKIDGVTPVGRATVAQLRINSPRQLASRREWLRLGLFP
jgi:hypothetical protein